METLFNCLVVVSILLALSPSKKQFESNTQTKKRFYPGGSLESYLKNHEASKEMQQRWMFGIVAGVCVDV